MGYHFVFPFGGVALFFADEVVPLVSVPVVVYEVVPFFFAPFADVVVQSFFAPFADVVAPSFFVPLADVAVEPEFVEVVERIGAAVAAVSFQFLHHYYFFFQTACYYFPGSYLVFLFGAVSALLH